MNMEVKLLIKFFQTKFNDTSNDQLPIQVPFISGIKDCFNVFRSIDTLHYTLKDRNYMVILIGKERLWTNFNVLS